MLTSLPNLLTLSRIGLIPVLLLLLYLNEPWARWTTGIGGQVPRAPPRATTQSSRLQIACGLSHSTPYWDLRMNG